MHIKYMCLFFLQNWYVYICILLLYPAFPPFTLYLSNRLIFSKKSYILNATFQEWSLDITSLVMDTNEP